MPIVGSGKDWVRKDGTGSGGIIPAASRHRSEVRLIGSQIARREALEAYNTCFPDIAKVFECLYRLSGRSELAVHFQASGQEKGLLRRLVKLRRAIKAGLKKAKKERQKAAAAQQAAAKG